MIITCPCRKKKFNMDENLIPDSGRLLKCGSCGETWFFNKTDKNINDTSQIILPESEKIDDETSEQPKIKKKEIKDSFSNLPHNKGSELVKYSSKSNFTISKFFNLLIVGIISFISIVIILDTFKNPLINIFPNLELILYNLFETLKDLVLFLKDLN